MFFALLGLALLAVFALALCFRGPRFFRRPLHPHPDAHGYSRKKPAWVRREVIRLKAVMLHDGCRKIAAAFNSHFAHKGETVGKSYVAQISKRHALEIQLFRSKLKNRTRKQGPRGLILALDLTFVRHETPVLGILDHGTRALLFLGSETAPPSASCASSST